MQIWFLFVLISIHCAKHIYARFRAVQQRLTGLGAPREFEAFTADLYRLADWLTECRVETVVMESTGVYWIPLFGVLEERGFDVMLVDPRRIKNVPGRKTDVLDCQWLQQLHTYGLLSGAFRLTRIYAACAATCGSGPCWWSTPHTTSSISRKR